MNWTEQKTAKGIANGEIWVQVKYSEPTAKLEAEEVYRTRVIGPDWPDSVIRQRISQLNVIDIDAIQLGKATAPQPTSDPPAPTKEDSDRQQWFSDFAAEQTADALTKISEGLAARYKPEYGNLR